MDLIDVKLIMTHDYRTMKFKIGIHPLRII
jgi:hypothetical protein